MKTRIVKNGNSWSLTLPKKAVVALEQNETLHIQLRDDTLIISKTNKKKPRHNWENQFAEAFKNEPLTLEELLEKVTSENIHPEIQPSKIEGKEIW